jgi:hypothetical protein
MNFGRHVSNRLKNIYIWNSGVESYRMVYIWVQSEGGGGVGGGRGRSDFFGPPLQKITGPLLRNFEYVIGIFSSSPVDWHPFRANWVKGGDCGHGLKSEARALGAGRGVSQANEAAIYPKLTELCQHDIVCGILKNCKQCGTVQASYGCLVGHVCMGVRISVFAP